MKMKATMKSNNIIAPDQQILTLHKYARYEKDFKTYGKPGTPFKHSLLLRILS